MVTALALMLLCYLLPQLVRSRQFLLDSRVEDRFSGDLRVLATAGAGAPGAASAGHAPHHGQPAARPYLHDPARRPEAPAVNRPHARTGRPSDDARALAAARAARAARVSRRAAAIRRRRILTAVLLVLAVAGWVGVGLGRVPWVIAAAPTLLLVTVLELGRRTAIKARAHDRRDRAEMARLEERLRALSAREGDGAPRQPRPGARPAGRPAARSTAPVRSRAGARPAARPDVVTPARAASAPAGDGGAAAEASPGSPAVAGLPAAASPGVAGSPSVTSPARAGSRSAAVSPAATVSPATAASAGAGSPAAAVSPAPAASPAAAASPAVVVSPMSPPSALSAPSPAVAASPGTAAVSASSPAEVAGPALDGEAEVPAPASPWTPVPVPVPSYTLKPTAPRRDVDPYVDAPVGATAAVPQRPTTASPAAAAASLTEPVAVTLDLDAVLARRRAAGE